MVQFQYNREVPFSYFWENQLSIFRPHSNGGGCSWIGIIAAERNLNLSNACDDVWAFQRNLQHFVAVYNGRLSVSAIGTASSQRCS